MPLEILIDEKVIIKGPDEGDHLLLTKIHHFSQFGFMLLKD